eukprot:5042620-Ditylum_brightwellii.AAC.1
MLFVTTLQIQQLVVTERMKCNTQPCPIPFEDRFGGVYRRKNLDCKEGQKRQKGLEGSLIKSKEIADNRDHLSIWMMSLWSNLIGGRVNDILTDAKSHIKAK